MKGKNGKGDLGSGSISNAINETVSNGSSNDSSSSIKQTLYTCAKSIDTSHGSKSITIYKKDCNTYAI